APPHIYTLSLHDALPIYQVGGHRLTARIALEHDAGLGGTARQVEPLGRGREHLALAVERARLEAMRQEGGAELHALLPRRLRQRSEEHTSELQSRSDLVC